MSKLRELDIESSAISHPHKDHLFLIKEESRVELSDDLLVLIVLELQQICNPMEVTDFENPVEVHILLVPHIIYIHPLMTDHGRSSGRAQSCTNHDERRSRTSHQCPSP
jgi:hypothetical protein